MALSNYDTDVTDIGNKELTQLKSLADLNLHKSRVTEAGAQELRKAMPDCKIIFNK